MIARNGAKCPDLRWLTPPVPALATVSTGPTPQAANESLAWSEVVVVYVGQIMTDQSRDDMDRRVYIVEWRTLRHCKVGIYTGDSE